MRLRAVAWLAAAFCLGPVKARASASVTAADSDPDAITAQKPGLMLFAESSTDPLILRVTAELESQGFSLVTVAAPTIDITSDRALRMAQSTEAVALVRIITSGNSVVVSLSDLVQNQTFEHAIAADTDRAVTALRVVEALRSRLTDLLALAPEAAPAPRPSKPPRKVPRVPGDSGSVRTLALAIAVAKSTGRSGAGVLLHAGFRAVLAPPYGFELLALIPVSPATLHSPDVGSAEIDFGLLTVGGLYQPLSPARSAWVADFGLGAGGLLLRAEGVGEGTVRGTGHSRLSFFPYFRTGFGAAFSDAFRARVDVLGGAALPGAEILSNDEVIDTWGRLVLIATAGMEGVWH